MHTTYTLHEAEKRGKNDLGWLQSRFSFSFADYYDPEKMGFGTLRVLNDDSIAPGQGFGKHPHRDMEIITIPTAGSLSHGDSMGNSTIIEAGEVQAMSAGTGVVHSEMNHNPYETVSLFQIWILTRENGIKPSYSQKRFDPSDRSDTFQLLVSPDGREDSVMIHQDAFISRVSISKDTQLSYTKYISKNLIYIFVIEGSIQVSEYTLEKRDALGIEGDDTLSIGAGEESDVLVIEVPKVG